jgi:hypothetical protein
MGSVTAAAQESAHPAAATCPMAATTKDGQSLARIGGRHQLRDNGGAWAAV